MLPLLQQNYCEQAEHVALAYLESDPFDFYAWFVAGFCAGQLGRWDDAIMRLEQAVRLSEHETTPDGYQARLVLCKHLLAAGHDQQAREVVIQALQSHTVPEELGNDTGNLLVKCELFDHAIHCYKIAIESNCNRTQALNNLGNVLVMAGKPEQAIEVLKRAATENNAAETLSNLAAAYDSLGEFNKSGKFHKQAISMEPDQPVFNVNYALHLLKQGQIADALPFYTYRFHLPGWAGEPDCLKNLNLPASGDRFEPGTVVVGEQGLGDEIYLLKLLAGMNRPEHWSYIGDVRIARLFARTFVEARFIPRQSDTSATQLDQANSIWRFDHVLLTACQQKASHSGSELAANKESGAYWKQALANINAKPKIGISWTGGRRLKDRLRREICPAKWKALALNDKFSIIDIQYDDRPHERESLARALDRKVRRLPQFDLENNLDHSMAILEAVDFVITVDNSTTHLTGALGVETFVLLPKVPDWRWGMVGSKVDCYPSLTLFRQQHLNDWSKPLGEISMKLAG